MLVADAVGAAVGTAGATLPPPHPAMTIAARNRDGKRKRSITPADDDISIKLALVAMSATAQLA
jgi:hypothetical protein